MMELKQPDTILERIQNVYQEYPLPLWVLMTGTFIATERPNWITAQSLGPLAAASVMDHFGPRSVWYGCSIVCGISIIGFYRLHLYARERLNEKQE